MEHYDYLIIGAGIIGLTIARELKQRFPDCSVGIIEKESDVALHASGRNSGVLHAGFYYSTDSLKAKFTRDGNKAMTRYCEENNLKINKCGKIVVATNAEELNGLQELKKRADANGVELNWIDEKHLSLIDPNAKTFRKALYSPTTSTVDPVEICTTLKNEIAGNGVDLFFNCLYKEHKNEVVYAGNEIFRCRYLINAAGLYADKVAHEYGFGTNYTIIPFKGMYLKYSKNKSDVMTNIYPVPDSNNPFLGVHFTKTVDGSIKIGPTAIPAFWRENYSKFHNFRMREFLIILFYESRLFLLNSFHFRTLAIREMKKYLKTYFINLPLKMVKKIDKQGFGEFITSGIRAQLLDKRTLQLVQDFVVEGDHRSIHVLNAVSPAFTCSFPFSKYVVDLIIEKQGGNRVEAG